MERSCTSVAIRKKTVWETKLKHDEGVVFLLYIDNNMLLTDVEIVFFADKSYEIFTTIAAHPQVFA